ncbi:MAG: hypothetical protein ED859_11695 [Desulfuromonadales bacterium]|nr:MAG: hypothetical protein ED859_11695 [Desulfuromonadales bacterium]
MKLFRKWTVALAAGAIVTGVAVVSLPSAEAAAEAAPQPWMNVLLKGKFGFTAWRSCVQTLYAPGFEPDSQALACDSENITFIESGTLTFNGNGTLTANNISVTSMEPGKLTAGATPVRAGIKSSCTGTYSVMADRSFNAEMNCSAPLPDGIVLTMGPFRYTGHMDFPVSTLTLSELEGNVQTLSLKMGETPLHQFERICTSSGTLVRIGY